MFIAPDLLFYWFKHYSNRSFLVFTHLPTCICVCLLEMWLDLNEVNRRWIVRVRFIEYEVEGCWSGRPCVLHILNQQKPGNQGHRLDMYTQEWDVFICASVDAICVRSYGNITHWFSPDGQYCVTFTVQAWRVHVFVCMCVCNRQALVNSCSRLHEPCNHLIGFPDSILTALRNRR